MTIMEPGPVVVAPAPTTAPPAPNVQEPPLVVIHHRGPRRVRRPLVAASAAVVALAAAIALWSPWSGQHASRGPVLTPPPSYVQITGVSAHSVAFSWSAPMTDAPVVGYEITREGAFSDFVMPAETTYVATGLASGRSYHFEVIAVYEQSMSVPSVSLHATTSR